MSAPTWYADPTTTADLDGAIVAVPITAAPRGLPVGAVVTVGGVKLTTSANVNVGDVSISIEAATIGTLIASGATVSGFAQVDLSTNFPRGIAFYYRGMIFGGIEPIAKFPTPNLAYKVQTIQGFDLPAVASDDPQRTLDSGLFAGNDVLGGRSIIITLAIAANSPTNLDAARAAVAAMMTPDPAGVVEYPLQFTTPGGSQYAVNARPRRVAYRIDTNPILAFGLVATLQLNTTDPRIYSCPTQRLHLVADGGAVAGTAANNGSMEMRPLFVITAGEGSPDSVTVQQADIAGSPPLGFMIEGGMVGTDEIFVDTDFHTAWYVPASGGPYDGLKYLTSESKWWNLPKGDAGPNNIHFTCPTGTATLNLDYADAFSAV